TASGHAGEYISLRRPDHPHESAHDGSHRPGRRDRRRDRGDARTDHWPEHAPRRVRRRTSRRTGMISDGTQDRRAIEEPGPGPDGRPHDEQPEWRRDFPIDWPADEYVSRRDLVKFMGLTSAAFLAGQLWLVAKSLFGSKKRAADPRAV